MSRLFEMETFLVVVEAGSFTAAADRLGVTKSYASKLVARLEDRLGARLLQRTTRQLKLTEVGRSYYERCSEAMRALSEAEAEATELQTSPQGRLRISLPSAFAIRHLAGPIAEFKTRYPALTIEAVLLDRKVDILAEGFDLAVRIGDLQDSSLIARKLASVDRAICASPSYLLRRGTPQKPADLIEHDCLLYAYHAVPTTWRFHGPSGETTVEVSGHMVSNHGELLVEAACQGLGLVFCPLFLTAHELRAGRLLRVLPAWRAPLAISAVFPNARHIPAKVRLFVDFLVSHFAHPCWADCD
ncbi:MAG: LysR family transcriptional regulator [Myxococcales bacterium]|nr:LysR family transcriptional regulator [Myxococcales bacterium]